MTTWIETTTVQSTARAGLPNLDVYGLSEEFTLAEALHLTWKALGDSLGMQPRDWFDTAGDRMYAAVVWCETRTDLDKPVVEDDEIVATTRFEAVRPPHALSHTQFTVNGEVKGEIRLLTSFVKRDVKGTNKKFSKVRGIWNVEPVNPEKIEAIHTRHHELRATEGLEEEIVTHEVSRLTDFNNAGLFYFRNFVRLARTAEWAAGRDGETCLAAWREGFYFGNADDCAQVSVRCAPQGDHMRTEEWSAGKRLFVSFADLKPVTLPFI